MKTRDIKQLLHRYFEGETSVDEERILTAYFNSDEVASELKEYSGFFRGISELSKPDNENSIEADIMHYIDEHEEGKKSKRMWLWQAVTGIAATVILVIGGYLLYQEQDKQFSDTFDDPEIAYAYAQQTLKYVSSKYNQGLAALSNFDKLNSAAEPLQQGIQPINDYFYMIDRMYSVNDTNQENNSTDLKQNE